MYVTPVEHLISSLSGVVGVPVVTLVPRPMPELFTRLDVISSRSETPVTDSTQIAVQVYGEGLESVINLIGQVRFFLMDHVYVNNPKIIWWSETSAPTRFPDPDVPDVHRWQMVGELTTTLT